MIRWFLLALALLLTVASTAGAADRCLGVDPRASLGLADADATSCHVRTSRSRYPLPDPQCTPGATNPTITAQVLRNPAYRTSCTRDGASSAAEKRSTYATYGIKPPRSNSGKTQTCELDHLISLELGGADTLDNIWPQCGPAGVALPRRFFKLKDAVENYLAAQVKAGRVALKKAQAGIAEDWSQYLDAAQKAKRRGR